MGIESTGRYLIKGQSGNLPSGEGYIAPVEDSAYGSILADGSIINRVPLALGLEG